MANSPEIHDSILYIDDEKENLDAFRITFRKQYNVFTASTPNEFFQIIANNTIKVILADQRMPLQSGVELLERTATLYPEIIRVMITAYTDVDTILQAVNRSKIYAFVNKPWKSNELQLIIENAIESYNIKTENKNLIEGVKKANEQLSKLNNNLVQEVANKEKAEFKLASYAEQLEESVRLRTLEIEQKNQHLQSVNEEMSQIVEELTTTNEQLEHSNNRLLSEINTRRQIEDMLAESENKFRSFIEQSSEGIMVLDKKGRIIEWNQALSKIYGSTGDKYLGMYLYEFEYLLLPVTDQNIERKLQLKQEFDNYLKTIDEADVVYVEKYCTTFIGNKKFLSLTMFPIHTVNASFVGRIVRDLTNKKRNEEKIANYQLHLEKLVEIKTQEAIEKEIKIQAISTQTEEKLKKNKEIIQFVQDSITLTYGDKFFETLVMNISKSLQANFTFVADLLPGGKSITTKAFYANDKILPNEVFLLENTPCQMVIKNGYYSVSENVAELFPGSLVQKYLIKAYYGKILLNSFQQPVGIVASMFTKSIPDEELTKQLLEILSGRIGIELERQMAEKALVENEQKLLNIFNNSSDGILITDFNQRFIEANETIENIIGYKRKELLLLKTKDFVLPAYWKLLDKRQKMLKRKGIAPSAEIEIMTKEGKVVLVELNSKKIEDNGVAVVLTLVRDVSDRKNLEKQLFETILTTEEKEREKFAGNLHDELGPLLSSLKMYISLFVESSDNVKKEYILIQIQTLIKEAITSVREISNDLSPHVLLNYGLATAINSFVNLKREWIKIQFTNKVGTKRYSNNLEVMVYRIVKELINNTIKHARAKLIEMKLTETNKAIYLFYKDNGIGFEAEEVIGKKEGSIGLMNILRRIKSINGRYKFASSKGEGVAFELLIPLE